MISNTLSHTLHPYLLNGDFFSFRLVCSVFAKNTRVGGILKKRQRERYILGVLCSPERVYRGVSIVFFFELLAPDELTPEVCMTAVDYRAKLLFDFIPLEKKTVDLCIRAVMNHRSLMGRVPYVLRTERFYLSVLFHNGALLRYIPHDQRTRQMRTIAMLSNPVGALKIIDDDEKTEEWCWKCINDDARSFEHVPERLRTREMYLNVLTRNPLLLRHMTPIEIKLEYAWLALKGEPMLLELVPAHLKSKEMCWYCVQKCGRCIRWVPEHLLTEALCIEAEKTYSYGRNYLKRVLDYRAEDANKRRRKR